MKTLVPAYGRDYKSKKAVLTDWLGSKDFIIADMSDPYDGKPCNLEDLKSAGIKSVCIRYKKLTQIAVIEVK